MRGFIIQLLSGTVQVTYRYRRIQYRAALPLARLMVLTAFTGGDAAAGAGCWRRHSEIQNISSAATGKQNPLRGRGEHLGSLLLCSQFVWRWFCYSP